MHEGDSEVKVLAIVKPTDFNNLIMANIFPIKTKT